MKRTSTSHPTHTAYIVDGEGEATFWTKVGAAWTHEDGNGFNIALTALPLNGRLVIRTAKAGEKAGDKTSDKAGAGR